MTWSLYGATRTRDHKIASRAGKTKAQMPQHNMKLPYDKNQASIYATQTTAPALRNV